MVTDTHSHLLSTPLGRIYIEALLIPEGSAIYNKNILVLLCLLYNNFIFCILRSSQGQLQLTRNPFCYKISNSPFFERQRSSQ